MAEHVVRRCISALFWAPEKVGLRQRLLILFPSVADPRKSSGAVSFSSPCRFASLAPDYHFRFQVYPFILGDPQPRGKKSEVVASPLPSRGPKRGCKCYVNPAFLGLPNKEEQNQK